MNNGHRSRQRRLARGFEGEVAVSALSGCGTVLAVLGKTTGEQGQALRLVLDVGAHVPGLGLGQQGALRERVDDVHPGLLRLGCGLHAGQLVGLHEAHGVGNPVDVVFADAVIRGSQETDTFTHDLKHAAAQLHPLLLRLGLPDLDPANDRAMICGSPSMLKETAEMLDAKGFKGVCGMEHGNAIPGKEGELALLSFAGDAFVISPLTPDHNNIRLLVPDLKPEIMPAQGSNMLAALQQADNLLRQAGYPRGDVVVFTDGFDNNSFRELQDLINNWPHRLSVLGFGSEDGAPVQLENGELLKTATGAVVIPKLPQQQLATLTRQSGGVYTQASNSGSMLNDIMSQQEPAPAQADIQDAPTQVQVAGREFTLPRALQRLAAKHGKWLQLGGIATAKIPAGGDYHISLLYISKDTEVPQHTHLGLEMTLVLAGKIVDENGEYVAGDLLINSPDDTHTPRTLADEDCLCLSVLSAPLQFKKGLTRLLNPLQQFFY